MELFDLVIIVPVREVLLLEILLELLPHNLPFIDLLYFPEMLPPYGCSYGQIENGYSSFHIPRIVLDLEFFSHPKKPSFSFLTSLYLTIKGRRPFLLKFISWVVPVAPPSLILVRRRTWISNGPFRVRRLTRWYISSSSSVLTPFWIFCLVLGVHISLNICQTLQHGRT